MSLLTRAFCVLGKNCLTTVRYMIEKMMVATLNSPHETEKPLKLLTSMKESEVGKKRRRGKKKVRPSSSPYHIQSNIAHSDTTPSKDTTATSPYRYSPKAPENYTQFLICDHGEPMSSSDDADLTSFLEEQFESEIKQARENELARLSRTELSNMVCDLENRRSELKSCLRRPCVCCCSNNNSTSTESPVYDCHSAANNMQVSNIDSTNDLHDQLRQLQEENEELHRKNVVLRGYLSSDVPI